MTRLFVWMARYVGLAGVVHETIVHDLERPALLAAFAGLMAAADRIEARGR